MSHRVRAFLATAGALLALAAWLAPASALARHHHDAHSASPGDFDYYLLSLSWSPAYCLEAPGAVECSGQRRFGFIVHGLWPQSDRDAPEHCNFRRGVPPGVVADISDLMPARGLIYHEWSAHGTCSGLEPSAYFALIRRAYAAISIPAEVAGTHAAVEQSTESILAAFMRANPRLPPASLMVTCSGNDAPRLREVRICLERNLAPRTCAPDALRAACRAVRVIVPPLR